MAAAADGALAVIGALSLDPLPTSLDGARLLGERAATSALTRAGAESCGGACRLLEAANGTIALNLARDADWELLPAWLEADTPHDWNAVRDAVASREVEALVARGRELGLALSAVDAHHATAAQWFRVTTEHAATRSRRRAAPRVIDLSSLWAGPLCSHLLQLGGADVIKVEGLARPDGARQGPRAFFDLLNAGKRSVALDLAHAAGRAQLLALLRDADIVVEASRPRALRQLGIDAGKIVLESPDLTWISLTGHGRGEPQEQWIAYGDDAGVDAGLSRVMRQITGDAMFVGDAIADPLAGLHAAAVAWCSWRSGGSRLVSIALSDVVRSIVERSAPAGSDMDWRELHRGGIALLRESGAIVEPPSARTPSGCAPDLGADTVAVLRELTGTC
ncbi:hypothetical protein B1810_18155 [Panacagrimonas perspica]|nr:hypothetical protein B1810_18155 [Panacagrimonas perspica]